MTESDLTLYLHHVEVVLLTGLLFIYYVQYFASQLGRIVIKK